LETFFRTAYLSYSHIRRIARRRYLTAALLALPVIAACARVAFDRSAAAGSINWLAPIACAVVVGTVIWVQRCSDSASGFDLAFVNSPLSGSAVGLSRAAAGVSIFVIQVTVFVGILTTGR